MTRRFGGLLGAALVLGVFVYGLFALGFSVSLFTHGIGRLTFIVGLMLPPDPQTWHRVVYYLGQLAQTLGIAFLGTLVAAVLAFPLGFLAARNVVANRVVHVLSRRFFDTMRGVDILVWALIWINVVGLGPFAGVLAIICSDFGALGKLFSEAVEAVDRGSVDGVVSGGGSPVQAVRFGVMPQVLPVMTSQVLYFFESNTRSATIIGIVGAGGIGLSLSEMIATLEWQQVSFIIVLLLVTVSVIDLLSTRLRMAIIGPKPI
jgi:phosphonate transport system permease protein